METYLVGGAVRDRLLGRSVKDRDWVVTGSSPEEMIGLGFRPVGKDFPVFLHPQSHEEYALARTERKVAPGYHGFSFHASPEVTIEEDLRRRDLTINAIAEDMHGQLIDPYGGQQDIADRCLRHVSDAFAEDPVRVLRSARFAARLAPYGFALADETMQLMRDMVASGEVDALVAERVWQELGQVLTEPQASVFFSVLRDCRALIRLFPELDALFGVPQTEIHHPEIDTGLHTMLALDYAATAGMAAEVCFAVLCHDFGKAVTAAKYWPHHRGHERTGVRIVEAFCSRLRVPRRFRDLAKLVCEYHTHCHRAVELRPASVLRLLEAIDAFRRPQRLDDFVAACLADARGRKGFDDIGYPQAGILAEALAAARAVDISGLCRQGNSGEKLKRLIRSQRVAAIKAQRALPSDDLSG